MWTLPELLLLSAGLKAKPQEEDDLVCDLEGRKPPPQQHTMKCSGGRPAALGQGQILPEKGEAWCRRNVIEPGLRG